jgi:hypothetical protein
VHLHSAASAAAPRGVAETGSWLRSEGAKERRVYHDSLRMASRVHLGGAVAVAVAVAEAEAVALLTAKARRRVILQMLLRDTSETRTRQRRPPAPGHMHRCTCKGQSA